MQYWCFCFLNSLPDKLMPANLTATHSIKKTKRCEIWLQRKNKYSVNEGRSTSEINKTDSWQNLIGYVCVLLLLILPLVALFMDEIVKKQDFLLSRLLLWGQSFEVREQRSFPFCGIMKPLSTSAWYLAFDIFRESSITDFIYTILCISLCASVQDAGLRDFEHARLLSPEVGGHSMKIQTGIYETCLETNTE